MRRIPASVAHIFLALGSFALLRGSTCVVVYCSEPCDPCVTQCKCHTCPHPGAMAFEPAHRLVAFELIEEVDGQGLQHQTLAWIGGLGGAHATGHQEFAPRDLREFAEGVVGVNHELLDLEPALGDWQFGSGALAGGFRLVTFARGGGGSMKSDSTWHIVQVDEVQAHEGKKPTKVKRSYEKVGGEASFSFGDTENTAQLESPFEGATLQLSGDDDDVKVEFLDGKKPDHEGALVGHKLGLALDALLPDKEVEKDAHWDLDSAQIKRALGLDLRKALYPPPPAPENAGGGGGGGGGRRGGGMGGGGGLGGIPAGAEWHGQG